MKNARRGDPTITAGTLEMARVILFGLDVVTGAVTLSGGRSLNAGMTADEAVRVFGEDSEGLEGEGDYYLIEVKGGFAGRTFDIVTFRFDRDEKLALVSFRANRMDWKHYEDPDGALHRARENRDLLCGCLGPPRRENVHSSLFAYPWGFVHSGEFGFWIEYPRSCDRCKTYLRRTQKRKVRVPR